MVYPPSSSSASQRDMEQMLRLHFIMKEPSYKNYPAPVDININILPLRGIWFHLGAHRNVLKQKSLFFAEKLKDDRPLDHLDIPICDDSESFVEILVLMYCSDLLKRFLHDDNVPKILRLLRASIAFKFREGTRSCLDYLEAVPWPEEEEEDIVAELKRLRPQIPVRQVLDRVLIEPATLEKAAQTYCNCHRALVKVNIKDEDVSLKGDEPGPEQPQAPTRKGEDISLEGDDEPGHEQSQAPTDVPSHSETTNTSMGNLYHQLGDNITSLIVNLREAEALQGEVQESFWQRIASRAGSILESVDMLIQQQMGDKLVDFWAQQKELCGLLAGVPVTYRYEISNITVRLCIAIGKRQLLASKVARSSLLETWLKSLCEDFGSMLWNHRRFDRETMEDGLRETILTLPMDHQDVMLQAWFYWLSKDPKRDFPDLWKGLEMWTRRAFVRQCRASVLDELLFSSQSQVVLSMKKTLSSSSSGLS